MQWSPIPFCGYTGPQSNADALAAEGCHWPSVAAGPLPRDQQAQRQWLGADCLFKQRQRRRRTGPGAVRLRALVRAASATRLVNSAGDHVRRSCAACGASSEQLSPCHADQEIIRRFHHAKDYATRMKTIGKNELFTMVRLVH